MIMAVQYVKGSNPLGALGNVAGLAGTAMGVPWLTALGMGMDAYGQFRSGAGYKTPGWINKNSLDEVGGLFGNIASKDNPDQKTKRGKLG